MPFKPSHKKSVLWLAITAAQLGLTSLVALPSMALADELPYEADPKGDMFGASAKAYSRGRETLDWVPRDALTAEQLTRCKQACEGAYIEPKRTDAEANMRPDAAPVRASASESRWVQESKAELSGDVEVVQGYRLLTADKAVFDQANRTATIEGHVVLRQPGAVMFAEKLSVDEGKGETRMEDTQFVLHDAHMRGHAASLTQQSGARVGDDIYTLEDGSFTMCAPEDNTWLMRGAEINIDNATGQGTAKHMRLELSDVPVFYAPYFRFPASDKRMTGLLFPTLAHSDRNGLEYAQPIYFNLAPDYDLTLAPRWLEHRGLSMEGEARHLSRYFSTTIAGAYLGDDKGGNNQNLQDKADAGEIDQSDVTPYQGEDRWMYGVKQTGGAGQAWRTQIDYAEVSDIDYLREFDSGSIETSSRTHLLQTASAGYAFEHWQLGVKAEAHQNISATGVEPYRQLPRVDLDGNYEFDGGWSLRLLNQYTVFDHSDDYWDETDPTPTDKRIVGDRLRADYRVAWDNQWLWGFLTPAVMAKHLQYDLDPERLSAGANTAPSLTGAQVSLDSGLFFEREGALFGGDYVQTFEPRLFYFNSPEIDHSDLYGITDTGRSVQFDSSETTFSYDQLFRASRFNGGDRIDDANQLSVGLTSRFQSAQTGAELLRLSLGQIFYFADRQVTLDGLPQDSPRSEIAGQIAAQIGANWRYSFDMAYSQDNYKPSQASTSLRYGDEQGRVLSLGYRYQRNGSAVDTNTGELYDTTIDQTDIGIVYPLTGDWNLLARSFYDHTLGREMDTFAGVEYDSCCYRMRFLARRWTDSRDIATVGPSNLEVDRGVFLEFQLKGLGTLGQRLDQVLREGIIGFDQRPQYEP
ncbi:LPS-assembly protein LptD [Simiduia litorea]|uniref:LPS-assembly protein LptD n=1 Tax=Simiduia litorea TaxID=1435348 RepID=UPI0036F420D1